MLDSKTPIPIVDTGDLERVWRLIRTTIKSRGTGVSIDQNLLRQQCGPSADVNAVFVRAALLGHLFDTRLVSEWLEGNQLAPGVFEITANFELDMGVQGFDPIQFTNRIRSRLG